MSLISRADLGRLDGRPPGVRHRADRPDAGHPGGPRRGVHHLGADRQDGSRPVDQRACHPDGDHADDHRTG